MTLYEHLSVLISIVIGLGLTHILSNVHALVQARERVRTHWLPITWAALIFVGLVQWWWTSFTFQTRAEEWTFFYFLFLLLRPVVGYLGAAFVLPNVPAEGPCDLRAYYFGIKGWFFALLAGGNTLDGLRRMLEGVPAEDVAVWSNFVSAALLGSLGFTDREGYHAAITLLTATLFGMFLVQSALTLP